MADGRRGALASGEPLVGAVEEPVGREAVKVVRGGTSLEADGGGGLLADSPTRPRPRCARTARRVGSASALTTARPSSLMAPHF